MIIVAVGALLCAGCGHDSESAYVCERYEVHPVEFYDLETECYPKPLDWYPEEQVSTADFDLSYEGVTCPGDYNWACRREVLIDGQPAMKCRLPAIPLPRYCSQTDEGTFEEINASRFGWYYCENPGESFTDACEDALDNDADGFTDCEDDECAACGNCSADGIGDPVLCPERCRYMVGLTDSALGLQLNAYNTSLGSLAVSTAELNCCLPTDEQR